MGQLTQYNKLPEATEQAYRGGWFHSGDLAEYDEEGFFYYRGRKKESMRRLGENISAWEIETVLNQHPKVLECAAHAVKSELGRRRGEDLGRVAARRAPHARGGPRLLQGQDGLLRHPRGTWSWSSRCRRRRPSAVQYATLKERGITEQTWDREKAGYKVERA